ncbi:hypothetical protein [Actinomadura sp.]|uniref:hypothetical protein n=1 Tax=Actinomadura sp. TaxID=1989 RepID=UPI003356D9E5
MVAGYWALVLLGGLGVDFLGAGTDADAGAGAGAGDAHGGDADGGDGFLAERLAVLGLGGVPATVVLSLLIAVAWFVSLAVAASGGVLRFLALPAALAAAWLVTRAAVLPLRRVFQDQVAASLRDFVGLPCVIRTGRVGTDFGQAEVTAPDGSSAIIQVRLTAADVPAAGAAPDGTGLTAGSTALIFDFDPNGQFFWVMPHDAASGLAGGPRPVR